MRFPATLAHTPENCRLNPGVVGFYTQHVVVSIARYVGEEAQADREQPVDFGPRGTLLEHRGKNSKKAHREMAEAADPTTIGHGANRKFWLGMVLGGAGALALGSIISSKRLPRTAPYRPNPLKLPSLWGADRYSPD